MRGVLLNKVPGLKREQWHMVIGTFQKRPPWVCHLATAGISEQQLSHRKERGPVGTSPSHRCFSLHLTSSRCNKPGIVCNANSSHQAAPTLRLKHKWSTSSWHHLRKFTIADVSDTNSPTRDRRKEEERSVVRPKKRGRLPVKVCLISETLPTAVGY